MTNFTRHSLVLACLFAAPLGTSLVAQEKPEKPAAPAQIGALEMTEIPKETKLVEEKSLRLNTAVGAQLQFTPAQGGLYSRSDEGLAPNSMAGQLQSPPSDRDNAMPNATRLFSFWLDPGESIQIRRSTEEESSISMRLVQPNNQHPLSPQIMKVNRMPQPLRSKRIEFKNTTANPFKVVLLVYGRTGIPYKLEISRKS